MTDGDDSYVQTTYHVLKLYRDHLEGKRVDCLFDSPVMDAGRAGQLNVLDCSASITDDGSIRLFVTNISKTDTCELELPGSYAVQSALCMHADSFDACNAVGREVVQSTSKSASEAHIIAPGTVNMLILKQI